MCVAVCVAVEKVVGEGGGERGEGVVVVNEWNGSIR